MVPRWTATFDLGEVIKLAEHAQAGTKFWNYQGNEPELLLIHDDGVYVMSNAEPRVKAHWSKEYPPGTWLEGDDFCEPIPLRDDRFDELKRMLADGHSEFQVFITEEMLELRYLT